jgi:hypothetical protein
MHCVKLIVEVLWTGITAWELSRYLVLALLHVLGPLLRHSNTSSSLCFMCWDLSLVIQVPRPRFDVQCWYLHLLQKVPCLFRSVKYWDLHLVLMPPQLVILHLVMFDSDLLAFSQDVHVKPQYMLTNLNIIFFHPQV